MTPASLSMASTTSFPLGTNGTSGMTLGGVWATVKVKPISTAANNTCNRMAFPLHQKYRIARASQARSVQVDTNGVGGLTIGGNDHIHLSAPEQRNGKLHVHLIQTGI